MTVADHLFAGLLDGAPRDADFPGLEFKRLDPAGRRVMRVDLAAFGPVAPDGVADQQNKDDEDSGIGNRNTNR